MAIKEKMQLVEKGSHEEIILAPPHPPVNMKYRKLIVAIEDKIMSMPGAIIGNNFPLKHVFAEGIYMRELTIPKGMFVVGELHKHSYVNCFLSGDMTILTEKGVKRVKGPISIISPAETKRFGYSHTDVVWVTVHPNPTNSTDIRKLEKEIHAENYDDLPIKVINADNEASSVANEVFHRFINHISIIEKWYDEKVFRTLTRRIFNHEKPGFWSDWTEEQQKLYMSGDWEAFSISRGYTEEEIADLKLWISMREEGERLGFAPLEAIKDLSAAVAIKNIAMDKKGEILKSSHIPSSSKIPYEPVKQGGLK